MGLLGNNFTRWMGLKAAKQREKDEASRRDSDIGRQLKLEKEKAKKTFKILLLGAGESGKSTIIKQMGIDYSSALSEDEPKTRINESTFEIGSTKVQILDVDIQEPSRKKWLNCFEDVGYMIFVAALSSYDQHTAKGHNAMHEEMMLFDFLANGEQFKHKPVIVFLNKLDVFEKKIAVSPLSEYFTDFNGPDTNFDNSRRYRYRAPAIMLTWKRYDGKVDIWSAGCILAEMILSRPLFPGKDHIDQFCVIKQLLGSPPEEMIENVANIDLYSLPTEADAEATHKGFHTPMERVHYEMLQIDPERRCSAEEALEEQYLAPYHDPSDEPVAKEKSDWGLLDADLPADVWKTVMYSEVLGYHGSGVNSDDIFS
ncbi:hypothetical protein PENNAL_c0125G02515 [Penicillium nalgiovense]|uniref:Protein kinase domain-containing protein n=1 Tax=Penicillium nalgiovense TaxID=60175 RepID=A0A1V6X4I3_PENNA|nr:hypothetical protein PENNAL_c0125G02515 [Penicillium nalgiovense]